MPPFDPKWLAPGALPSALRALQAEAERRRANTTDTGSDTDRRREWALSYAGRPVEFIGEIMGPEWWSDDWIGWRAFVAALFGLPMPDAELDLFRRFAGGRNPPTTRQREAWVAIGRRGGKSRTLAMLGVYLACCEDWTDCLAPGELGFVRVLANNRPNAHAIMGYAKAALRHPKLEPLVVKPLAESIELLGSVAIEVGTASIGAVRARTIIVALCVAVGTLIETEADSRPIEDIRAGDRVWTRRGLRPVLKSGMTNASAKVYSINFSNGRSLIATAEHPVFVCQKGFVAVSSLHVGDEVLEWKQVIASIAERNTVVISVRELHESVPVYNLEVDDTPEYFANGVLVHNCDEIAHWEPDEESANPDREILNALRPAMLTIPRGMVLAASSVYARKGVLWDAFRRWYGKDDGPVFLKASTVEMHPSVDRTDIDRAYEEDPIAAGAEYGSEFRRDITAFVTAEALDAVRVDGRHELLPMPGVDYLAFTDPSGGSADSFTLAIAHRAAAGTIVLDLLREATPPFSPDAIVAEFAEDCRRYGVFRVTGDAYGGIWPTERFAEYGIAYEVSDLNKSSIYQAWLPLLNAAKMEVLDNQRLTNQALNLERRLTRGGRESIDHVPGYHDDVVNAAAGAMVLADGARYPAMWTLDEMRVVA